MDTQRAAINGIQIVGVIPEPASVSLMAVIAGISFFVRRRLAV